MMSELDLKELRQKLETELKTLERDLGGIARHNPLRDEDWELKPAETQEIEFRDETADRLEAFDETAEVERHLERRLRNINLALQKMAAGRYGLCEICDGTIESDRLQTNPAARTCKKHLRNGDHLP